MNRLFVLTILRILDERWVKGTFETHEHSEYGQLEITNINDERFHALETDIVPNTSPNLEVLRYDDRALIFEKGALPF